jgi:predicted nucleic acid-binding protein
MIGLHGLVIDASVAVSIARQEREAERAITAISNSTTNNERVVVPAFFWTEVADALLTRHKWTGAAVLAAIHHLDEMRLETLEIDRPLVVLAIDLAERYGLTVYDASYLALAFSTDAHLATFDKALRAAAGPRAIHIGQHRLSEPSAAYEHTVTWPNYKGASAFLAKLRAEAARPG